VNSKLTKINKEFYQKQFALYGEADVRSLGWSSTESQQKRFAAIDKMIQAQGATILDVGCGFGDFCLHVKQAKAYTGIDTNFAAVQVAQKNYAHYVPSQISFHCLSFTDYSAAPSVDWIVGSGLFAFGIDMALIKNMFEFVNKGMIINFLSAWTAGAMVDGRNYVWPVDILHDLSNSLYTRKIALDHSYLPNDFTVAIYK
jgi:SAM-dependent methyltransferase